MSSQPHQSDPGMEDTGDLANRIGRASERAKRERTDACRAALPGRAYWVTVSVTGASTLTAWGGLLVDLSHDDTNRIGYRGAVILAVAALLALASMITIAVGAHEYCANLRTGRIAAQLNTQHRAVMRVLNTLADQPSGTEGRNQRPWTEIAGLIERANEASETYGATVTPIIGGAPRPRNGRSG